MKLKAAHRIFRIRDQIQAQVNEARTRLQVLEESSDHASLEEATTGYDFACAKVATARAMLETALAEVAKHGTLKNDVIEALKTHRSDVEEVKGRIQNLLKELDHLAPKLSEAQEKVDAVQKSQAEEDEAQKAFKAAVTGAHVPVPHGGHPIYIEGLAMQHDPKTGKARLMRYAKRVSS